jgi:lipopolysaccharide transport system permease protein
VPPSEPLPRPTTVIEPARGWRLLDVREIWHYRELFFFLTWRDVKVRYKQTVLGAAWAILQPALMMVIFTIFFGRLAQLPAGSKPYPLFVFAGLLPWTFFATSVAQAGTSIVNSERLVTKVYFPRLAIPFAPVGAAVVDFVVAFGLLGLLMLYYGVAPSWGMALVPAILVLMMLAALGVGTLLAALNVRYRDFRYVIPFLVQLWMFATPTIYMDPHAVESRPAAEIAASTAPPADSSASASAEKKKPDAVTQGTLRAILALNPMTGIISFFRAAVLGGDLPWMDLALPIPTVIVTFIAALFYYRRVEDSFADVI